MKYKIYQEILITRTVIVEDMAKDDWEGLDEAASQIPKEEWSIENEDVQEQQYWDENCPWFKENEDE
tara:strand:+ start:515 stop:715 length:201 start_codon:yes stop_codon:yes gene_type:complete